MTLSPGTRLGPYEVIAQIGVGGMGVVYKATDTRLDRTVAIKVLPEHVASDPELKQRFEREAKTLAALSHPRICPVFDVGSQDGIDFLVMEYLEGETLAQRLSKGALSLDQALQVAIQIADALDRAHRKGIVHRDLKPGNIMLTKGGVGSAGSPQAKLLDFGLAKLRPAGVSDGVALSEVPTVSTPLTGAGSILGTLQYMAPEQLEGQEADARTDIFAFGAVVYEMVTGKKAFEGKSQASLAGAILHTQPVPLSSLQPAIPRNLERLVMTCLAKGPDDRWQTMRDLVRELQWDGNREHPNDLSTVAAVGRRRQFVRWAPVVVMISIAGVLLVSAQRPAPRRVESRLELSTPPPDNAASPGAASFAVSPDGTRIVYLAPAQDTEKLWLRSLAVSEAVPLPGTDGAMLPFWSPNGRSIGFFANFSLKTLEIDSGFVTRLIGAGNPGGGTWGEDGTILYSPNGSLPVFRIPASGGEAVAATALQPGEVRNHRFPHFLPDGRHFLYVANGSADARGVYLGQLDQTKTSRLLDADAAIYVAPGYLLFVREGALFAQRFDNRTFRLEGGVLRIGEGGFVVRPSGETVPALSASSTGTVVFRPGSPVAGIQWMRVDRSGRAVAAVGSPVATVNTWSAAISPDGARLALSLRRDGNADIWLMNLGDGRMSRLTFDPANDGRMLWSPDGRRLVFDSNRKGIRDLYQKPADGNGAEQLLLQTDVTKYLNDWSPDGRLLIYHTSGAQGVHQDIMALPMDGSGTPFSVIQTRFNEEGAQFSPDGRWLAYESNESGRAEIYVQPFPGSGGKFQMSSEGGRHVRWSNNGRELFYHSLDDNLMAVSVDVSATGAVESGVPAALFPLPGNVPYFPLPDGEHFLTARPTSASEPAPLTVILNWNAGLTE